MHQHAEHADDDGYKSPRLRHQTRANHCSFMKMTEKPIFAAMSKIPIRPTMRAKFG